MRLPSPKQCPTRWLTPDAVRRSARYSARAMRETTNWRTSSRTGRTALAATAVALFAAGVPVTVASAASAPAPTRYSIANGCFSVSGVGGAEKVRLQATTLGEYLLFRSDRTFVVAKPGGGVATAAEPTLAAEWKVTEAGDGAFVFAPKLEGAPPITTPITPADGCADLPRGAAERHRHAGQGRDRVRPRRRPRRGPHALDDLRVLRRAASTAAGRGTRTASPTRCPTARIDRGPAGHRRAVFQNFLNYGNPLQPHDTRRLPEADGVVQGQPDLRGHVLALDRARLDGRAAADGDERQREPRALRAAGQPHRRTATRWTPCAAASTTSATCRTTSTRRPAGRARASSRSSPTRTRRGA